MVKWPLLATQACVASSCVCFQLEEGFNSLLFWASLAHAYVAAVGRGEQKGSLGQVQVAGDG